MMDVKSIGLKRLLKPKSIAIIGGGVWGSAVIEQCQKIGFDGPIWPVHPSKDRLAGLAAFKSIADLPKAPDAAFIGVNRHATVESVKSLAARRAGGAICFASGFKEAQAEDDEAANLQDALIKASADMPIIGPNCYGFINYLDGAALWPDQHGGKIIESGVAILTQSSNIAINITMQKRGLPIAYMVTLGNQAKISLSDIGQTLLDDPRVTALGCHIEGFGDIAAFEALAAKARALGKVIICLKVGKSEQAQHNTLSHTASLAGSDAGAQALLDRLSIGRAHSLPEFIESLKLIHVTGGLGGTQIASLSCSGGEASLIADTALKYDVGFPALTPPQFSQLRQILGPKVALSNPLDYHTYIWHDPAALEATFSAMSGAEIDISFIILDFPRQDRCERKDWEILIPAIIQAAKTTQRPYGIIASLAENMPEAISEYLLAHNIAPMCGIDAALSAVRLAAQTAQKAKSVKPPILITQRPAHSRLLSEYDAKHALQAYGMPIPKSRSVSSPKQAADYAQSMGFPVVLKGENLAHKSEHDAVHLNLNSVEDVIAAAQKTPSDSYLIEAMIDQVIAEILVGIIRDDAHGFVLILAAGGIYTEILADRQSLLLPVTRQDIDHALLQLKIAPLLKGYRGKAAINKPALIDTVMALQDYVIDHADKIIEIDINPVLCRKDDVIIADALINIAD